MLGVSRHKELGQLIKKLISRQITDQGTVERYRDNSGLFGHDYDDCVAVLAHAYCGTVPSTESLTDIQTVGQRKYASRGKYPAVADYTSAVMQGRLIEEDIA